MGYGQPVMAEMTLREKVEVLEGQVEELGRQKANLMERLAEVEVQVLGHRPAPEGVEVRR